MLKVAPRSSDSITSLSALSASACSQRLFSSSMTGLPLKTEATDPDGMAWAIASSLLDRSLNKIVNKK